MRKQSTQLKNTGEIHPDDISYSDEYTAETQEIAFSAEQQAIWADLYAGIHQPYLLEHICRQFIAGLELLQLNPEQIPTIANLNESIYPRTGWKVKRTAVRYTPAENWYQQFARRVFLVTDYLRTRDQMEFTPEPDMFHDIFGHLPYLTQPFYARIEEMFAPAYQKATQAEREVIKRLAWYSTEFGLTLEDNRFKVFGAGIISGRGELAHTIMEFYRLSRDGVIDYQHDVFEQISEAFTTDKSHLDRMIAGINTLHQGGKMSSRAKGWNVMQQLYRKLGIRREGYLGGDVILAPFTIATIAQIPKTVYAYNPVFFVSQSLDQMAEDLKRYLEPIAERPAPPG